MKHGEEQLSKESLYNTGTRTEFNFSMGIKELIPLPLSIASNSSHISYKSAPFPRTLSP